MPSNILLWLPAIATVIALLSFLGVVGSFVAFRHGYSATTVDTQEKTIIALQAQVETLEKQVAFGAKEIVRMKGIISTIQIALKRRGLTIEIDGDVVTLVDNQSRQTRTVIRIEKNEAGTLEEPEPHSKKKEKEA